MDYSLSTEVQHFNILSSEIEKAYHYAAQKFGLSDSVMLILYTLSCNNGECLLKDITYGASKQTINSALRKLENDKIIYSKVFEGRKKKIFLTEEGKQFAQNTVSNIIKIENKIFDSWSDKDKNIYIELTQKYLEDFRREIKEL